MLDACELVRVCMVRACILRNVLAAKILRGTSCGAHAYSAYPKLLCVNVSRKEMFRLHWHVVFEAFQLGDSDIFRRLKNQEPMH